MSTTTGTTVQSEDTNLSSITLIPSNTQSPITNNGIPSSTTTDITNNEGFSTPVPSSYNTLPFYAKKFDYQTPCNSKTPFIVHLSELFGFTSAVNHSISFTYTITYTHTPKSYLVSQTRPFISIYLCFPFYT